MTYLKKQFKHAWRDLALRAFSLIGIICMVGGFLSPTYAQVKSDHQHNVVYGGLLSHGSLISGGYERFIPIADNTYLIGHVGIGYGEDFHFLELWNTTPLETYLTIPHSATIAFGRKRLLFEAGLGGTQYNGINVEDNYYLLYPIIGARLYLFKEQRFLLRLTAHYPRESKRLEPDILFSPVGLSVGFSF